jgi:hypothetical protein
MLARNLKPLTRAPRIIGPILTLLFTACASTPETQQTATEPAAPQSAPSAAMTPMAPETEIEAPESAQPPASEVKVAPTAPQTYVVVEGDTLWDISTRFLQEPWYWPEIWHENPQIKNPHLIYPGDVLSLYYVGGKPHLQVTGGPRVSGQAGAGLGTVKLKPRVRVASIDQADKAIPIRAIRQFIFEPKVVTKKQLDKAPYIVGGEDYRLIYGNSDVVYVRGLNRKDGNTRYSVIRPGEPLHDPHSGKLLGYNTLPVGDLSITKQGDPATGRLSNVKREALEGDRLFAHTDRPEEHSFFPHPPPETVNGSVISLYDAISMIGQLQVAVVNLGTRDGIDKGTVLTSYQRGPVVYDPHAEGFRRPKVKLPDEESGVMMVFQALDELSYALVMEAYRPIREGDDVRSP